MTDGTEPIPPTSETSEPASAARLERGAHRRTLLLLALIVLGAIVARAWSIGKPSLWIDEFYSLQASGGWLFADQQLPQQQVLHAVPDYTRLDAAEPWWKIPGSLGPDLQPPGYYVLLRWWRELFGDGVVAARSLSLVASIAALLLLWAAVCETHGPVAALWAAAIMAVSGPQIAFAQETRAYALAQVPALAAGWALLRLQAHGFSWGRIITLSACVLAMVLIHYYAVTLALALLLFGLLRPGRQQRRITVTALAAAGALFLLLWGPMLLEQRRQAAGNAVGTLSNPDQTIAQVVARAAAIPFYAVSAHPTPAAPVLGAALVGLALWRLRRDTGLLPWLLWLLVPIAFLAAMDLALGIQNLTTHRYWLAATPGAFALLAGLGAAAPARHRWAAHALPAAAVLYGLLWVSLAQYERMDWRPAAVEVARHVAPNDLVIYSGSGNPRQRWMVTLMYMGLRHYRPGLANPIAVLNEPAGEPFLEDVSRLVQADRVWLIGPATPETVPMLLPGFRAAEVRPLSIQANLLRVEPADARTAPPNS